MGNKKSVCYKCRYLILVPGGFFKRKTKHGPCDRCLGKMTIFQQIDQDRIWLKQLPKNKTNKNEDRREP